MIDETRRIPQYYIDNKSRLIPLGGKSGKIPQVRGWVEMRGLSIERAEAWLAKPPTEQAQHSIGWALSARDIVLDFDFGAKDAEGNDIGHKSFTYINDKVKAAFDGKNLSDITTMVGTPSGGFHAYFTLRKSAPPPSAFLVRSEDGTRLPKLDIRIFGGQVAIPPSYNRDKTEGQTGGFYNFVVGADGTPLPKAELPECLEALFKTRTAQEITQGVEIFSPEDIAYILAQFPTNRNYDYHAEFFPILAAVHHSTGGSEEAYQQFVKWSCSIEGDWAGDEPRWRESWEKLNVNPPRAYTFGTLRYHLSRFGGQLGVVGAKLAFTGMDMSTIAELDFPQEGSQDRTEPFERSYPIDELIALLRATGEKIGVKEGVENIGTEQKPVLVPNYLIQTHTFDRNVVSATQVDEENSTQVLAEPAAQVIKSLFPMAVLRSPELQRFLSRMGEHPEVFTRNAYRNVATALHNLSLTGQGGFTFNEFSNRLYFEDEMKKYQVKDALFTNIIAGNPGDMVEKAADKNQLAAYAELVGFRNRYNPVKIWLSGCQWDGEKRGADWVVDEVLGGKLGLVAEPVLAKAAFRAVLFAIIARATTENPNGVKFDNMLVLQSEAQGVGKSSFCPALVGEEYCLAGLRIPTSGRDEEHRSTAMKIAGKLVYEITELNAQAGKAAAQEMKSWLGLQADTYRKPWGRDEAEVPRRGVPIATTNDDKILRDMGGNRRFWIVQLLHKARHDFIDWHQLITHRNAFWAEIYDEWQAMDEGERKVALELPHEVATALDSTAAKAVQGSDEVSEVVQFLNDYPENEILRSHLRNQLESAGIELPDRQMNRKAVIAKAVKLAGWEEVRSSWLPTSGNYVYHRIKNLSKKELAARQKPAPAAGVAFAKAAE